MQEQRQLLVLLVLKSRELIPIEEKGRTYLLLKLTFIAACDVTVVTPIFMGLSA